MEKKIRVETVYVTCDGLYGNRCKQTNPARTDRIEH